MTGNVSLEKHREAFRSRGILYDWIDSIVFALVVVLAFNICFRIVSVDGPSMLPTLHSGDRLILTKLGGKPKYGDIVVSVQDNQMNEPIIKRVIAVGGQTVDLDTEKGLVYVDGEVLDEPYILEPTYMIPYPPMEFPVEVPDGMVFVMGDNRNDSIDSRSTAIGLIEERYILGKTIFRIYPFGSQFGPIDSVDLSKS